MVHHRNNVWNWINRPSLSVIVQCIHSRVWREHGGATTQLKAATSCQREDYFRQCSSFTFGNKFLRPNAKRLSNKITQNTPGRAERANWRPLRPCNGGTREARRRGHFWTFQTILLFSSRTFPAFSVFFQQNTTEHHVEGNFPTIKAINHEFLLPLAPDLPRSVNIVYQCTHPHPSTPIYTHLHPSVSINILITNNLFSIS